VDGIKEEQVYYGQDADAGRQVTLRERLRQKYEPEDFVTVINADTQPITYQFASPADQETYSDYPGHKNTIMRKPPRRLTIQPGVTKLCPAYEADQFIEAGIKQIAMRRVNTQVKDGKLDVQRATADWTDPIFQEEMIAKFFMGKKDILSQYNENINTVPASVEEDLNINEPVAAPKSTRRA